MRRREKDVKRAAPGCLGDMDPNLESIGVVLGIQAVHNKSLLMLLEFPSVKIHQVQYLGTCIHVLIQQVFIEHLLIFLN